MRKCISRAGTVSFVLDWQTTETCVLPDRHPRRADFFIRMGGIGWMMSDRERKGLAIIETAAPDVYAGARQSSPPLCQKFPRPMGRGILPSGFLGALRIGETGAALGGTDFRSPISVSQTHLWQL